MIVGASTHAMRAFQICMHGMHNPGGGDMSRPMLLRMPLAERLKAINEVA